MVASIRYMPALAQLPGPAASPTSTRSTLGCPSGSAAPAPVPTASTVQAGAAPQAVAIVVSSAAPVGVDSSIAAGCALSGAAASASIRSTAGTGTGTVPWAVLTDPEPAATGDTTRGHGPSSPSECSASAHPATSAMAKSRTGPGRPARDTIETTSDRLRVTSLPGASTTT